MHCADGVEVARGLADESVDLVYLDPPFNTGKTQKRERLRTERVEAGKGDRIGFGGHEYRTVRLGSRSFEDAFDDYLGFLEPFLAESRRVLKASGSLYLHLDYREAHYAKVLLDEVFGRECFVNEIIWAYDFGGRPKDRWPAKHDTILFYAKDPARRLFNADEVERIPYMAPGLAGPEKAARGKLPTDTWWAHDRAHERQGTAGLPDAEAAGRAAAHRERVVAGGRAGGGLRGGERDGGGGGAGAGAALRAGGPLGGGVRGDAAALRGGGGGGVPGVSLPILGVMRLALTPVSWRSREAPCGCS